MLAQVYYLVEPFVFKSCIIRRLFRNIYRANSSATTFFLAIRWKTTFLDEIAEMRQMERPK
jgi:hypothetical protein